MVNFSLPKLRLGKTNKEEHVEAKTAKSRSKKSKSKRSIMKSVVEKTAVDEDDKLKMEKKPQADTNLSVGRDTPADMMPVTQAWIQATDRVRKMFEIKAKEMKRLRLANRILMVVTVFISLATLCFACYEIYAASQAQNRITDAANACRLGPGASSCAYCVRKEKWYQFGHKMRCRDRVVSCTPPAGLDCSFGDHKISCFVDEDLKERTLSN
ncbi:unnamed protein product [Bursaphelenchus xylophilus]|uniref:(pine wood nematode) hypothetical protein n=1 Tax=Bursaphelenchus xylophilus TaxID=6326 RepID=A0A1I7SG07_BURXY|nr:unnamed protein product [Bursaphelenchus xylophilus]CAG9113024.1 unnamed protein product [Bursaphelenchus xylophilus]